MKFIAEYVGVGLLALLVCESLLALRWSSALFRTGLPVYRRTWAVTTPPAQLASSAMRVFAEQPTLRFRQVDGSPNILVRRSMGLRWQLFTRGMFTSTLGTASLTVRLSWWALLFFGILVVGLLLTLISPRTNEMFPSGPLRGVDLNLVFLPLVLLLGIVWTLGELRTFRAAASTLNTVAH